MRSEPVRARAPCTVEIASGTAGSAGEEDAARSAGPTMMPSSLSVATISSTCATPRGDSIIPSTRVFSSHAFLWSSGATRPNRPARLYVAKPRSPRGGYIAAATNAAASWAVSRCGARIPSAPWSSTRRTCPRSSSPTRTITGTPCTCASATWWRSATRSAGPCSQSISTKSNSATASISTSSSDGIRSRAPISFSPARARVRSDGITPPSRPTGRCRRRTCRASPASR